MFAKMQAFLAEELASVCVMAAAHLPFCKLV